MSADLDRPAVVTSDKGPLGALTDEPRVINAPASNRGWSGWLRPFVEKLANSLSNHIAGQIVAGVLTTAAATGAYLFVTKLPALRKVALPIGVVAVCLALFLMGSYWLSRRFARIQTQLDRFASEHERRIIESVQVRTYNLVTGLLDLEKAVQVVINGPLTLAPEWYMPAIQRSAKTLRAITGRPISACLKVAVVPSGSRIDARDIRVVRVANYPPSTAEAEFWATDSFPIASLLGNPRAEHFIEHRRSAQKYPTHAAGESLLVVRVADASGICRGFLWLSSPEPNAFDNDVCPAVAQILAARLAPVVIHYSKALNVRDERTIDTMMRLQGEING